MVFVGKKISKKILQGVKSIIQGVNSKPAVLEDSLPTPQEEQNNKSKHDSPFQPRT